MHSVFKHIVQTNLLIAVTGVLITLPALAAKKTRSTGDGKNGRTPVKIIQTGETNTKYTGQSLPMKTATGYVTIPHAYGHIAAYNLQIQDNSDKPYGFGQAKEGFMNINPAGTNPNPDAPNGAIWPRGANIVDTMLRIFTNDPNYADNRFLDSFDQPWTCYVGSSRYPLNMHHVSNYFKYSTRVVGN